jgi:tellurite resistance protein TerC
MVITQDELILYTSNIFAVMGLRAMFFMLSGILDKFYLLQKGLSILLIYIGFKMVLEMFHNEKLLGEDHFLTHFHIPIWASLTFIVTVLAGSIVLSLLFPKKETVVVAPENKAIN